MPKSDGMLEALERATKLKAARTAWLAQHGVPISEEFAKFAEAIGAVTDYLESLTAAEDRCGNCDHMTCLHNTRGCMVGIQFEGGRTGVKCPCAWNRSQASSELAAAESVIREARQPEKSALDSQQDSITAWAAKCFGDDQVNSPMVRALRLAEEAIEFAQSVTADPAKLHALIDYVWGSEDMQRDPVGSALYKPRVANHPQERMAEVAK